MSDDEIKGRIPSDNVLDDTPARALKFFGAVSQFAEIRAALETRGYNDEIHQKAWSLVTEAAGYRKPTVAAMVQGDAAKALAELDRWDEPNFRLIEKALHDFPDQQDFLFDNLTPQQGTGAIVSVGTLLKRLDILEEGVDRKATHKADVAAIKKLAARGYDEKERARLAALIKVAKGKSEAGTQVSEKEKAEQAEKEKKDNQTNRDQRKAKIALWRLLDEWSEVAKLTITRRDYLIFLGLAKRKKKSKGPEGGPSTGGDK